MTFLELFRKIVLRNVGLAQTENPGEEDNRLTLINNSERLLRSKLAEYRLWYTGDGDELLNFYTGHNMVEFNYEPIYSRNKRNYFWCISSTESDVKRTHSGQPRNIVDTLVLITKFPTVRCEGEDGEILRAIIKDCKLKSIYKNEQLPLTLVEGWGCYKINWDKDISDYPYPIYYSAENVDFIYKSKRIIGVVFKDYYTDGKNRKYLLTETRTLKYDHEKYLEIDKKLFKIDNTGEYITPVENYDDIPELVGLKNQEHIEIRNIKWLLAVPCIIFGSTSQSTGYGRSIFTGKIDLFDDLDQCLSQSSNTVRRSTAIEYYNSDFLERDPRTGIPKQPKAYDRKYTVYAGQRNADGGSTSSEPVQVTQPNLNMEQYSSEALSILIQILNGVISPATLGIDLSKKDNALAQREKEKVTIFTRNGIIDSEEDILRDLFNQLLCAYELMHTGEITKQDYDISIKFSEFADDSYENKLEKLGIAYDSKIISDEMFMDRLYSDSLSEEEYQRELEWLKQNHKEQEPFGLGEEDEV